VEDAGHDEVEREFVIVTNRDEANFLQVRGLGIADMELFDHDPEILTRLTIGLSEFDILDNIQESESRVLVGIDEEDGNLGVQLDVLSSCSERTELATKISLPKMATFVTSEQMDFLIGCASSTMPVFPSDLIVDPGIAFEVFTVAASTVHASAHFRAWLDVYFDDIDIGIPECSLFAVRGFDTLVGALAEFYFGEFIRPREVALVGGLPVVKNLRRITAAVRDMFSFDIQRYGFGLGFGKSFGALMQIIALATLNPNGNAKTIAERFLGLAVNILNGKDGGDSSMLTGLATLIVRVNADRPHTKPLPTIVLAPGILSPRRRTEHVKSIRDRVNTKWVKPRTRYRR
jgi:hypothetical protein